MQESLVNSVVTSLDKIGLYVKVSEDPHFLTTRTAIVKTNCYNLFCKTTFFPYREIIFHRFVKVMVTYLCVDMP